MGRKYLRPINNGNNVGDDAHIAPTKNLMISNIKETYYE